MTTKRRVFQKGVKLKPDTTALTEEGEIKYDDTAKKLQYQDDSTSRSVVSEDGTQTLTNKTIDATSATGSNTLSADAADIEYDNATSGLTATDVQAALDELDSALEGQNEASEISYDNATSGLTATNVQDALDEIDGDLDTHVGASSGVHGITGDVVGTTDTQTLTNKTIDADSNTISNIDDDEIKAGAAIDATKIADGSVDNTEFQHLDGVTSDIQPQLDAKLDDFSSVNDNRIVRTDGTSGDAIQESGVSIDDTDAMSGITQLDVDNIQLNGNTIASTDTDGDVNIDPDGNGDIVLTTTGTGETRIAGNQQTTGTVTNDFATDAAAGANQTLTAPSTKNIRLTGALTSIDMIPAGNDGQEIVLVNATGGELLLNNDTGGTAANRILTGTQAAITLKDEASIPLVYDNTESRWMVAAGVGGEAGGSYDIFYQENFEGAVTASDFTSGNNATFDNGGTLDGTLADETGSPIAGNTSLEYTMGASSTNDWIKSPTITLDNKQKGNRVVMSMYYTYDGDSSDIKIIGYDDTGNVVLTTNADTLPAAGNPTRFEVAFFVPASVSSLSWGFQVITGNSGAILTVDDVQISTYPIITQNIVNMEDWTAYTPTITGATATNVSYFYRRVGDTLEVQGFHTMNSPGATTYSISLPSGLQIDPDKVNTTADRHQVGFGQRIQSGQTARDQEYVMFLDVATDDTVIYNCFSFDSNTDYPKENGDDIFNSGESTTVLFSVPILGWESEVKHVITPAKSNLTEWVEFTPTASAGFGTLTNAEGYWRRVGDSMEVIGFFNAGSASGTVAEFDLPSGFDIDLTKLNSSGSRFTVGDTKRINGGTIINDGANTGFLFCDGTNTDKLFMCIDPTNDTTLDKNNVNAIIVAGDGMNFNFKVPIEGWDTNSQFLVAVPIQQRVVIKDIKSSGADGGTFTSGSYQTRDLNTIESQRFFVQLSTNQITLNAGTYYIKARCPAFRVNDHKAKLRDITGGTDLVIGEHDYSATGTNDGGSVATIEGEFSLSTQSVLEIQHRCTTTRPSEGFGRGPSFGDDNTFTVVIIDKLS